MVHADDLRCTGLLICMRETQVLRLYNNTSFRDASIASLRQYDRHKTADLIPL
jgi:hypothetical protein